MRKLLLLIAAAGTALAAVPPAMAAQGCGPGFHRSPRGRCISNRVIRPRVGGFYAGRGYWDGRRYWKQRYRHHGGWRYR